MRITFDPSKRERTLAERGLDFARAAAVFDGDHLTFEDDRHDYGERRLITIGPLTDRMVVLVWTPRGEARHVISMRKANDREQRRYEDRLGRS
ncbi:BrnT family toxin [Brevundimonas intermedia]|uniref:BrnT family toxin n=1 Tax=Brevundimonas intermedia TaxID=74315 RepID=A0A4Y9RTQ1_9CAUL|nr:BrnT family toxin [Brevundimonas intermedia]TFW12500.1 BrnT family toxin [Brevundimonas intermedia]